MIDEAVKIQCVNERCKTLNFLADRFCSKCRTPVVRRYLWVADETAPEYQVGDLIGDRFLFVSPHIVLDTEPGSPPPLSEDVPDDIVHYLKLFPYRIYLPQIYAHLEDSQSNWLLEYSSVPTDGRGQLMDSEMFPPLEGAWQGASPLRQLNWLWQMAQLWEPLAAQQVASNLFSPENLRVNGSLIQLRELTLDNSDVYNLETWGEKWLGWGEKADPQIAEIVTDIGLCLHGGLIDRAEAVVRILDRAIYRLGTEEYVRKYTTVSITDPGKKRKQNEDSCYPPPGESRDASQAIETLAIVCDGLGGQHGGEIASRLGINILQRELTNYYGEKELNSPENSIAWNPLAHQEKILAAVFKANNHISEINDQEKRKNRERMGTTAVMTLALDHEMYVTHVGDSRVYWISPQNCHQVTVDDDLASREVRCGYGFYRDVIQYPQTGALSQALGMDNAGNLYPHIQRFILDEDSIFLLCSDGLSDLDRVEQYWQSAIAPFFATKVDLAEIARKLLEIAIKQNGHDNITLSLVYCQVKLKRDRVKTKLSWQDLQQIIPDLPSPHDLPPVECSETPTESVTPPEITNTEDSADLAEPKKSNSKLRFMLIVFGLLVLIFLVFIGQGKIKNNNRQNHQLNYNQKK